MPCSKCGNPNNTVPNAYIQKYYPNAQTKFIAPNNYDEFLSF
jgi:hypothetical protein